MRILGVNKLRYFNARPRTVFDEYFDFAKQKMVPNFQIPPLGRNIRLTNLKGEAICIGRKAVRRGRFRLSYKKSSQQQQREHAFELVDASFKVLEQDRNDNFIS